MATKGYKTIKGKMGVLGWISRIALIVWTVVMIVWMVGAGNIASEQTTAGGAFGAGIGITMIIVLWVAGTVIFGIWAMLTRPAKTLVPTDGD